MELLHRGNQNRTVEPTKRNETSSRSHAVLQIVVERETKTAGISSTVVYGEWEVVVAQLAVLTRASGKLSLIDLAGSERASSTENTGQRLLEGANINRSLLALANCINALAVEDTVHKPSASYVCIDLLLAGVDACLAAASKGAWSSITCQTRALSRLETHAHTEGKALRFPFV
jgi:hypothetical protein